MRSTVSVSRDNRPVARSGCFLFLVGFLVYVFLIRRILARVLPKGYTGLSFFAKTRQYSRITAESIV